MAANLSDKLRWVLDKHGEYMSEWEIGFAGSVLSQRTWTEKQINCAERIVKEAPCKAGLRIPCFTSRNPRDAIEWCDTWRGVYLLAKRNQGLMYVGQSVNVGKRLKHHWQRGKRWDITKVYGCDGNELDALEKLLIALYNPSDNQTHPDIDSVRITLASRLSDVKAARGILRRWGRKIHAMRSNVVSLVDRVRVMGPGQVIVRAVRPLGEQRLCNVCDKKVGAKEVLRELRMLICAIKAGRIIVRKA